MSARANGMPLWFVRPIIDGFIREDMRRIFVGTLEAAMEFADALQLETGNQHAVKDPAR